MRESFVFHAEYIEDLPEEYKAQYLRYIYEYGINGIVPELTGLEKSLWVKIQRRIDSDIEQWEIEKIRRSEAGKKHSGNQYTKRKELEQMEQCSKCSNEMEQNGTDGTVFVTESDNVYVSASSSVSVSEVQEKGNIHKNNFQETCKNLLNLDKYCFSSDFEVKIKELCSKHKVNYSKYLEFVADQAKIQKPLNFTGFIYKTAIKDETMANYRATIPKRKRKVIDFGKVQCPICGSYQRQKDSPDVCVVCGFSEFDFDKPDKVNRFKKMLEKGA